MKKLSSIQFLIVCATLTGTMTGTVSAQGTEITEVVMYTVDADTAQLLRFVFATNEFDVIGAMYNQNGELMLDMESLALIPTGPFRGFYGVAVSGGPASSYKKLSRVSPLDASVWVYDINAANGPLGYTRAMTPRLFAPNEISPGEPGGWKLLAMKTAGGRTECYLNVVDPAYGQIIPVPGADPKGMPVRQGANFIMVEGLAIDEADQCFGTTYHATTKKSRLWHLDVNWGTATVSATPLSGFVMPERMEALEFAFGDNEMNPSGLPTPADGWTHANGVLIGFSDNENTLVVQNADMASPDVGSWQYLNTINGEPIAFMSIDTEGIVFTTRSRDPIEAILNGFD